MTEYTEPNKIFLLFILLLASVIGLFFYKSVSYVIYLAPEAQAQVEDYRASDPNDPVYKELINTQVVRDELQASGPNTKMAILEKHQGDVVLMNIYNPEGTGHGLWVDKVNGQWVKLYAGQEMPNCSIFEKTGIEPGINCLTPNGETSTTK